MIYIFICNDCDTKVERQRKKREKIGPRPYCHVCGKVMKRVIE